MSLNLKAAFKEMLCSDIGNYIEPRELAGKLFLREHISMTEYEAIIEHKGTLEQRRKVSDPNFDMFMNG